MKQPVSSLRQWMLEQYAPQFHLEKKTLLKQLEKPHLIKVLEALMYL